MENTILRSKMYTVYKRFTNEKLYRKLFTNNYVTTVSAVHSINTQSNSERTIHPYRTLHPWKSKKSFADDLIKNIIFNKDGLIAINKPYGISGIRHNYSNNQVKGSNIHQLPNAVDYTLSDCLPDIANSLGYSELKIIKAPEKYTSGITLLAVNEEVENAFANSARIAMNTRQIQNTYWVVTNMIPSSGRGKKKLGLTLKVNNLTGEKKPVILSKWSTNAVKRGEVKIMNVEYKILSNSTFNLSSLVEIKSSTFKWHAVRLFATTELFSPILGDNYHGARIQKVVGTFLKIDPFLQITEEPIIMNKELLNILKLSKSKQHIIPVHIHLRQFHLPSFYGHGKNLTLTAPLPPFFEWTCEQLKFKDYHEREDNQLVKYITVP